MSEQFNMSNMQDIERAQQLLWKCLNLLTGLQQPPHSPDEKTAMLNADAQAKGKQELIETAVKLFEGLTGTDIIVDASIPDVDDAHGGKP